MLTFTAFPVLSMSIPLFMDAAPAAKQETRLRGQLRPIRFDRTPAATHGDARCPRSIVADNPPSRHRFRESALVSLQAIGLEFLQKTAERTARLVQDGKDRVVDHVLLVPSHEIASSLRSEQP